MLLLLLLVCICSEIHGFNSTASYTPQNKTKRTSNQHIYTYGESKPVLFYVDNAPAAQTNTDVSSYNSPRAVPYGNGQIRGFFEPPKVAAQQVLYEFQQTPTNAVSNVHVKQLFHTPDEFEPQSSQPETNPNQYSASETVITPIQHSAYTNHGQNYANVYHPLYNIQPHHIQSQHYVPGKYFYVNGRIVYQPSSPAYQQNQQRLPLKFGANVQPQQKLMPPPVQPPASYSRFVPPQRHEMQAITSPVTPQPAPVHSQNAEENEDDEENASLQENEDDAEGNEEGERYQNAEDEAEEDGEKNPVFGRYRFDEDEERDDNERYREDDEAEEDEEDTRGGSSKYVTKKTRKSPKKNGKGKYNNKDNYSYSEGYSTSSKYEYPKKKKNGKKNGKTQKTRYFKGSRPEIEGRYSENIPITSKHKIFKEKWYVTEKRDDNSERSSEEFK